jgi:RimJ/RimL family protein N-acetyltransferase
VVAPELRVAPIRSAHLDLVPLTPRFVQAVVAGDRIGARAEIGAGVGGWLLADPHHLVQLDLAGQAAEARGFPGFGRAIVHGIPSGTRTVVGSIGFLGPPDERGRLEASCRVHPAHAGRGFASEALGALLDWAAVRFGVMRFLVAVPARHERGRPSSIVLALGPDRPIEPQVDQIASLLEPHPRPS